MAVFFPELVKPKYKKGPPSKLDIMWSKKLRDSIKIKKTVSIKSWGNQFMILREIEGLHPTRIDKVLNWYVLNIRKEFVPLALSAKCFRTKFEKIEQAMIRDLGQRVEVGDEARSIGIKVMRKRWPKVTREQLLESIQISLDNFNSFKAKIVATRGDRLATHVWAKLGTPSQFLENWYSDVYHSIKNWDAWNGELKRFNFRHDSKLLKLWGRKIAAKFTGSAGRWDQLMERILNAD